MCVCVWGKSSAGDRAAARKVKVVQKHFTRKEKNKNTNPQRNGVKQTEAVWCLMEDLFQDAEDDGGGDLWDETEEERL